MSQTASPSRTARSAVLQDQIRVVLNGFKAAIENARVKLEDAIEIDTVDEVPQTPRTAEPRTAEPKTPHGPKFDEGLFAPTNLSK